MKGTEKQIAWAEDIIANCTKIFDGAIEDIRVKFAGDPNLEKALDAIKGNRDRIINASYAGDVIDLFQGIRYTGNTERDFGDLMGVYKVHVPTTDGQRKILGK